MIEDRKKTATEQNNGGETGDITIALAGNPNSGKTSLFNNLTGSRQHVGNWPGVTVEKKEGWTNFDGKKIKVIDLPGTYSLTAYSIEEVVARDFVVRGGADVVVVVIDASNLERNLYLALQIIELGANVVFALNMMDIVKKSGGAIDIKLLSEFVGAPVVETVARSNKGTDDLLRAALDASRGAAPRREINISYGRSIEAEIDKLTAGCSPAWQAETGMRPRWVAVKLIEKDRDVMDRISGLLGGAELLKEAENSRNRLSDLLKDDPETLVADQRYGFISGLIREVYRRPDISRRTISDKVDSVVANRVLGFPIFLFFMWMTFQITFTVGAKPVEWLGAMFDKLSEILSRMPGDTLLESLLVDGVVGGVGGVLSFLPVIILLFLAIAILEDSGYMARAAFIMDRVMHNIGLHGKSFIPMLVGFGCSVPAIMATRTLESRKDRIITILIIPLMSCGARLPVYVLLAGAFFTENAGHVIFSMYLIGVVLAILAAKIFHRLLFPGKSSPFVMELPPYRLPTLKSILLLMWERSWLYLKKAGTILLAISIVVWALTAFPRTFPGRDGLETRLKQAGAAVEKSKNPSESDLEEVTIIENEIKKLNLEHSYAGRLGKTLEPVFMPLGFDWRASIAMIAGLAAKEVVVSTLGTIYSLGETDEQSQGLKHALKNDPTFSPLKAYVLMLFALISIPCMATIAVIKRETESWKWPMLSAGYHFGLAWLVCFLVYQGGRLMGLGG